MARIPQMKMARYVVIRIKLPDLQKGTEMGSESATEIHCKSTKC